MGDYFKPWRRKLGVVTLGLACVFMAVWMRSFLVTDVFVRAVRSQSAEWKHQIICYRCLSTNGVLYWNRESHPYFDSESLDSLLSRFKPNPSWRTLKGASRNKDALWEINNPILRNGTLWQIKYPVLKWGVYGFGIHRHKFRDSLQLEILKVDYWFIVMPLTLLSAWLLLSRPRKRIENERIFS